MMGHKKNREETIPCDFFGGSQKSKRLFLPFKHNHMNVGMQLWLAVASDNSDVPGFLNPGSLSDTAWSDKIPLITHCSEAPVPRRRGLSDSSPSSTQLDKVMPSYK